MNESAASATLSGSGPPLRSIVDIARITRLVLPRNGFEDVPSIGIEILAAVRCKLADSPLLVAAILEVDKSSVSAPLRQLCDLGLLEQRRNPEDGRAKLLNLTRQGEQLIQRYEEWMRLRFKVNWITDHHLSLLAEIPNSTDSEQEG